MNTNRLSLMKRILAIYAICMLIGWVGFLLVSMKYGDGFWKFVFWWDVRIGKGDDSFMDFFNSIRDASLLSGCYSDRQVIYPPFANLIFLLLSRFTSKEYNATPFEDRYAIYQYLPGLMLYVLFIVVCVIMYISLISGNRRNDRITNCLIMFCGIFTIPFLYCIERGNILILALVFTLFFFEGYKSKNKFVKELAIMALGAAAGVKLYPAVFAIVLLCERKYLDTLKCFVYFLVISFISVIPFGGISSIFIWVQNIIRFISTQTDSGLFAFFTSGANFLNSIDYLFNVSVSSRIFALMLTVVQIAICLLTAYFAQEKWKRLLALTVLSILIPGSGGLYSFTFFIIPIMAMFDEEPTRDSALWAIPYLVIIGLACFPYPFPVMIDGQKVSVNAFFCSWIVVLLSLTLAIDGISHMRRGKCFVQ